MDHDAGATASAGVRALAAELAAIVGADRVLADSYSLALYSYDGGTDAAPADLVVIPEDGAQLAAVMAAIGRAGVALVPRGGGTGLAGAVIPCEGGVTISFARLRRILSVRPEHLTARVEGGVVNLYLGRAVAPLGLQFAPDPSSQAASTIGGNMAMNAGGPHTLAYGVTANHVLGIRLLLADGDAVDLGGLAPDAPGYDLTSLVVGSEGTMGVAAEIQVRLIPRPEAVRTMTATFTDVEQCAGCVGAIIRSGVIPAALEMMDNNTIRAIEAATHAGYPVEAAAVLLIELEGVVEAVETGLDSVIELCKGAGAGELKVAGSDAERAGLWKARKEAGGAMGRLAPNYYVMDGVVPRNTLPQVLAAVERVAGAHGLRAATLLHAGDGNIHPALLFDSDQPGAIDRVRAAGAEILQVCLDQGGSITGEHGIGVEKLDVVRRMFSEDDLAIMLRVRDVFDPHRRCNPGKLFPTPGRCIELHGRSLIEAHW
ncbi:MAG: FAD-binding oxidoreductase [Chloroflexota bacterium]